MHGVNAGRRICDLSAIWSARPHTDVLYWGLKTQPVSLRWHFLARPWALATHWYKWKLICCDRLVASLGPDSKAAQSNCVNCIQELKPAQGWNKLYLKSHKFMFGTGKLSDLGDTMTSTAAVEQTHHHVDSLWLKHSIFPQYFLTRSVLLLLHSGFTKLYLFYNKCSLTRRFHVTPPLTSALLGIAPPSVLIPKWLQQQCVRTHTWGRTQNSSSSDPGGIPA